MVYKCMKCKKEISSEQLSKRIICPYCGYRIIQKTRPSTIKHVKAV